MLTADPPPQPGVPVDSPPHWVVPAALVALGIIMVAVFYPLTRYFFSQDDFMLLYWAQNEPGRVMSDMFGRVPHYFRPLTVVGYFVAGLKLFGLNATPYHTISLILHVINAWLVFEVLRAMRVSVWGALVAASIFGLNVAFLHVVGWITCIQQLAGFLFCLLCAWLYFRAIGTGRHRDAVLSAVCYLLAIASVERPFSIPVLLALAVFLRLVPVATNRARSIVWLIPHGALMLVYLAHRVLWKGGTSAETLTFGSNVWSNLVTYLGGTFRLWADVGDRIPGGGSLQPSHIALLILVLYLLLRRRFAVAAFGVIYILVMYLPSLPLTDHTYYYHGYLPFFGILLLLAAVLDDAGLLLQRFVPRWAAPVAVALVFVVLGIGSYVKVRDNVKRATDPETWDDASFVIRRAVISEIAIADLLERRSAFDGVTQVRMIFGWKGKEELGGWHRGVWWAVGTGLGIDMFFGKNIEVTWEKLLAPAEQWLPVDTGGTRVVVYDRAGHCRLLSEIVSAPEPAPDDETGSE